MKRKDLSCLSDSELLKSTEEAVLSEREAIAWVLDHLREVGKRRLYAKMGYSSLFSYCTEHLKYCRASAQLRIDSMRLSEEIPEVKEALVQGRVTLSSVGVLQTYLRHEKSSVKSAEEKKELFLSIQNLPALEVKRQLTELSPQAFPKESVRVLGLDQTEIKLVVDQETLELLGQMRARLRGRGVASPSMADGVKAALKKAFGIRESRVSGSSDELSELTHRSAGSSDAPNDLAQRSSSSSDKLKPQESPLQKPNARPYIRAAIRETLKRKTGAQCTYVSPISGKRCGERHLLQIEHIKPFAQGGSSEIENLTHHCPAHNRLRAVESYGAAKMSRYLRK